MSPKEAAVELMRRAALVKANLRDAEGATLRQAQARAKLSSSGPFRQAALDRMGHPYAKRAPNPPLPPSVINVQSGRFRTGFRRRLGRWTNGNLSSTLTNVAPEAKFVLAPGGTRYMIERPLRRWLIADIRAGRKARLKQALKRGLKG